MREAHGWHLAIASRIVTLPMKPESRTRSLLVRWHEGDRAALDVLLEQNIEWLRRHVQKRLGARLRERARTTDFVQDTALRILQYSPRFVVSGEQQFRALLGRIVENVLRDQHHWFSAQRRAWHREQPLPSESALDLDGARSRVERPSQILSRKETEAWLHLGMKLLEPEDQEVIHLRQWQGLSFAEVGSQLGVSENTARMRFNRALERLASKTRRLRSGQIEDAIRPDHDAQDEEEQDESWE